MSFKGDRRHGKACQIMYDFHENSKRETSNCKGIEKLWTHQTSQMWKPLHINSILSWVKSTVILPFSIKRRWITKGKGKLKMKFRCIKGMTACNLNTFGALTDPLSSLLQKFSSGKDSNIYLLQLLGSRRSTKQGNLGSNYSSDYYRGSLGYHMQRFK